MALSSSSLGFLPVEVRLYRVAVFVFLYLVCLVAPVCRVGQPFAYYGVAHVVHKLAVLRVGDFLLVHPEAFDRDVPYGSLLSPQAVFLFQAHLEVAPRYHHHPVGRRLREGLAARAGDLASRRHRRLAAEASRERERRHGAECRYDCSLVHICYSNLTLLCLFRPFFPRSMSVW